jgi:hypothetical protein
MVTNKLKFNDGKTELLVIAPKHHHSALMQQNLTVQVGDTVITPSKQVRNLGGVLDYQMSMKSQVSAVTRGVYFNIHRVSKIRSHLSKDTCSQIVNALVTSRLDYHNGLLINHPDSTIAPLQRAQNSAARLITGARRRDHISPILRHLHWLPVKQRLVFKVLLLVYKALNVESAPSYLTDCLKLHQPSRCLRSASSPKLLEIPRVAKNAGTQAFSVAGPRLWNALPPNLRLCPSVSVFKKDLKTFLFEQDLN